jgi:hypothetical protein
MARGAGRGVVCRVTSPALVPRKLGNARSWGGCSSRHRDVVSRNERLDTFVSRAFVKTHTDTRADCFSP